MVNISKILKVDIVMALSLIQYRRKHTELGGSKNENFQEIEMDFMFCAKKKLPPTLVSRIKTGIWCKKQGFGRGGRCKQHPHN